MFKLVISDDEGKTTVVPFIRDEITIGRKAGNTIRLTDRNVSRRHARIRREGDDGFIIEDVGSYCGTKIEGRTLRGGEAPINSGEQITIGDYSLSIRTDVSAAVPLGRQMESGDEVGIGRVTPHARLVMLKGPEPGKEHELTAELYVLGRSEEANLRVDDASISRAHARIDCDEGKWTLSDLDSINGIYINGFRKDDYLLKPGDYIELGTVVFRYVAPGEPYDFRPLTEEIDIDSVSKPQLSRLAYFFIGLGVVAVAAIVGITFFLTSPDSEESADLAWESVANEEDGARLFIERGKDRMQREHWGDAARFFARALQLDPENGVAREMKALAIGEADAQQAQLKGVAAGERGNWKEAVRLLSLVPRSSQYYSGVDLTKMAGKFCEELIEKAKFVAGTGELEEALEVLGEIDRILSAPQRCYQEKDMVAEDLERRAATPAPERDAPKTKRNIEENPYG